MALPVTITGISTAVAPVGPFKSIYGARYTIHTGTTSSFAFPTVSAGNQAYGQTFTTDASADQIISSVIFRVSKASTPTDGLVAQLYETDGTDPVGSPVAVSAELLAADVTSTQTPYTFVFTAPYTAQPSTVYAVVLARTGVNDSTNNFSIGRASSDVYAGGGAVYQSIAGWGNSPNDLYCIVGGAEAYYFFGRDGTSANNLDIYKATDPTSSWAQLATQAASGLATISAFQVDNVIHLVLGHNVGTVQYSYYTFDTATDTLSTSEIIATGLTTTGQQGALQTGCAIVVRSNGEVVAVFNGAQTSTMGTAYARVYYSRRTDVNTWTAPVQVDANTAFDNIALGTALGTADAVHLFMAISPGTITQRTLSSGNVLQTASTGTGSTILAKDFHARSFDNAGVAVIHTVYQGSASGSSRLDLFNSANTPSFSSITVEATGTVPRLFIDAGGPTTAKAWVLYRDSADSDLYTEYGSGTSNTTSGKANVMSGTIASAVENLSVDGEIYTRGSSVVIPYIVNDNGTLKYNEYEVRSVATDGWNPSDKSSAVALSNSNRKATLASSTASGVRSTQLFSSGKYYAEFQLLNFSGGVYVGLNNSSASLTSLTSDTVILASGDGAVYVGGVAGPDCGTVAVNDIISMAWDATAERVWFRINAGNWNGSGTANPATNTGGVDVSAFAGNYGLWFWGAASGNSATVRTTLAEFTQGIVAGFYSWSGEPPVAPPSETLTALTGTVTLAGGAPTRLSVGRKALVTAGAVTLAGVNVNFRKGYPLVANAGAFSLAGQTVTLRVARKVIATAGALTVAGIDVTLTYAPAATHYVMTVTPGAFTLAGQNATLRFGHKFQAGTGAFALAGQSVTLRYAHKLQAQVGARTINGQNVTLRFGHKFQAGAGAFALAGQNVTLRATRKMQAGTGAVVLAGQSVTLTYTGITDIVMNVLTGAFTHTGQNATLRVARKMQAGTGAFVRTGQNATLRYAHKLLAQTGARLLNGQNVTLRRARNLQATPGSFLLTPTTASLRLARKLQAVSGAVVLTGNAVTLTQGGAALVMQVLPGAFALAGQTVGLGRGYTLNAASGAFALTGVDTNLFVTQHYRLAVTAGTFAVRSNTVELHRWQQPGRLTFGRNVVVIPGRW